MISFIYIYAAVLKWFDKFSENRQKSSIDTIKAGRKFDESKGLNY
jgi:hypothetical protein